MHFCTLQSQNAHKNFHFRRSAPFRRSNANWVVVFGVASSSHTATGDGFNGKHNILQVNIAQSRTLCTSCSVVPVKIESHFYIFPPPLAGFASTSRESHRGHQDLSCVMCHHVASCDPCLAGPAPTTAHGSCTCTQQQLVRKTLGVGPIGPSNPTENSSLISTMHRKIKH